EITPWEEHYVLDLPEKPEDLRFGNSVTRHRIKSGIKKATNQGVEVRHADSEKDLRAWYELYLGTMRWHGAMARPYSFFAAMWELLKPRGLFRLILAEQNRGGTRRLMSGYMLLMGGRTVH
ncbi:MAG: GNAT family N-acetyltransferase, partial [Rubrivivax sp.]|nr:GNAT family N-acetyltransferase [Rubrivivax sp.]